MLESISVKDDLETRLPLASILGSFGSHLLKFTLDTYLGLLEFPVRICDALQPEHTRDVPNLSYDCDLITTFIGF